MKRVITYGTFDLFHVGHLNLLKRAKALGDYLIVGVTSSAYDKERGKLNVRDTLLERVENVRATKLADKIVVEEFEGQKILDIKNNNVDIFAIGSDWLGKFDYLSEYCQVVYLERTRGISSSQLRLVGKQTLRMGIIGSGRIANRFIKESKYVSGINVEGVYNPNMASASMFALKNELSFATDNISDLFDKSDAIYIASPHHTHYQYIIESLNNGKHVLCEKPITLSSVETQNAYSLARQKSLVLLEALKTAYLPAFEHLIILAKSGRIGNIVDIEASFSKLTGMGLRETRADMFGGSVNELGSYVCLPIIKLLGGEYEKLIASSIIEDGIDIFSKAFFKYPNATASFKVALGAKTEGSLVISGTKGYIYVGAPWWKTDYFEMRFENSRDTNKFFYKFEGDGLRYELNDFVSMINDNHLESTKLPHTDSIAISKILECYKKNII